MESLTVVLVPSEALTEKESVQCVSGEVEGFVEGVRPESVVDVDGAKAACGRALDSWRKLG